MDLLSSNPCYSRIGCTCFLSASSSDSPYPWWAMLDQSKGSPEPRCKGKIFVKALSLHKPLRVQKTAHIASKVSVLALKKHRIWHKLPLNTESGDSINEICLQSGRENAVGFLISAQIHGQWKQITSPRLFARAAWPPVLYVQKKQRGTEGESAKETRHSLRAIMWWTGVDYNPHHPWLWPWFPNMYLRTR